MKLIQTFSFLLVFVGLAQLDVSAASKAKAQPLRVACCGDSITFGSGIEQRETNSYPAVLQNLMGKKFEVRNFGNPGRCVIQTSMRGSEKRGWIFMKEFKEALAFNPHIVIFNLGINDIMDWAKEKDRFVADYLDLLDHFKKLETKPMIIIWSDLAPLYPGQAFYNSPHLVEMNAALKEVVTKAKVIGLDMYTPLSEKPELFPDHIHPNGEGAQIIAETTFQLLKQKLKR